MTENFSIFDTLRGPCGIAWTSTGVTRIQLPEERPAATEARLEELHPEAQKTAPRGQAARAVKLLTAHLGGRPKDLSPIALDMTGITPFRAKVYEALRTVKSGSWVTYGTLATMAQSSGAARAVGQAMANNPFPLVVPCHRVLTSGQRIGGFSAHGGAQTKVDLLALERVTLPGSALGLDFDPLEAAKALAASDPKMGSLIKQVGPLRLLVDPMESPFVALVKAIVYQQLTGKAAYTILGRVKARFGGRVPKPDELLETTDDDLRGCGLSRAKVAGLKDLSTKTLEGVVPSLRALRFMDDEAIIDRLVAIRGIGRWSVEMLLIFRLGRPDVFPVDDYGMRKGLKFLRGEDGDILSPQQTAPIGERWRPYRTMASWYLWRAAEMG